MNAMTLITANPPIRLCVRSDYPAPTATRTGYRRKNGRAGLRGERPARKVSGGNADVKPSTEVTGGVFRRAAIALHHAAHTAHTAHVRHAATRHCRGRLLLFD